MAPPPLTVTNEAMFGFFLFLRCNCSKSSEKWKDIVGPDSSEGLTVKLPPGSHSTGGICHSGKFAFRQIYPDCFFNWVRSVSSSARQSALFSSNIPLLFGGLTLAKHLLDICCFLFIAASLMLVIYCETQVFRSSRANGKTDSEPVYNIQLAS